MRRQSVEAIGLRIAVVRDVVGITQAQLAKSVGLSRTQITNIEAGRSDIPLQRFIAIARVLKVKPERLLG